MNKMEDYLGYSVAFANHPLRFFASIAQANATMNKKYLDAYKRYVELSEKEFAILADSNSVEDFFSRQKAVVEEAVNSTGEALSQTADVIEESYRPLNSLMAQALEENAEKRKKTASRSSKSRAA